MKIKRLRMQGFLSYKKLCDIDFSRFENSLFLICGETGSGKTSIFDAICYALYGEASGNLRSRDNLRSKFSDFTGETFVKLDFEYKGESYFIERRPAQSVQKLRGEGERLQPPTAQLLKNNVLLAEKTNEVDRKISELLGLSREQFSKVCMLAQGDFARFLNASTAEKGKILESIFDISEIKSFNALLEKRKKLEEKELEGLNSESLSLLSSIKGFSTPANSEELKRADSASVNELKRLISADESALLELEKSLLELSERQRKNLALIERANERRELLERLNFSKQKLAEILLLLEKIGKSELALEEKAPQIERDKLSLAKLNELLPLKSRLFELNRSLQSCIYKEGEKQKQLEATERSLAETKERIKALSLYDEKIRLCLERENKLFSEANGLKTEIDLLYERNESCKKALELYKSQEKQKKTLEELKKQFSKAKKELEEKEESFINSQAQLLAHELRDNCPCPVCGSRLHPSPARSASPISREELDYFREEKEKIQERLNGAEAALSSSSSIYKLRLGDLNDSLEKLRLANSELAKSLESKKGAEHMELLRALYSEKQKEYNTLVENNMKIALQRQKMQAELKSRPSLEKNQAQLEKEMSVTNDEIKALAVKKAQASTSILEAKALAQSELNARGLKSLGEIDGEINNLQSQIADFEKRKTLLAEQKKANESQKNILMERERAQTEQLKTIGDIDEKSAIDERESLNAQRQLSQKKRDELSLTLSTNKITFKRLEEIAKRLLKLNKSYACLERLYQTAQGQLREKTRLSLETYAQQLFVDDMLKNANARLKNLNNSSFTLSFSKESRANSQVGLDLNACFLATGEERPVGTLSGGEGFMASLALALGLSDSIVSRSGGLELRSLFIDEGFGTLSSSLLDAALESLSSLSQNDVMIGIISHIDAVKERLPNRINVKKDKFNGSEVVVQNA